MEKIVDVLRERWESRRLMCNGRYLPTFIEDVGTAAAENVRSAALRRWIDRHQSKARTWLNSVRSGCVEQEPLAATREVYLDSESRIDLKIVQKERDVAYVETKWASQPSYEQL